jgi:hypothetical protein
VSCGTACSSVGWDVFDARRVRVWLGGAPGRPVSVAASRRQAQSAVAGRGRARRPSAREPCRSSRAERGKRCTSGCIADRGASPGRFVGNPGAPMGTLRRARLAPHRSGSMGRGPVRSPSSRSCRASAERGGNARANCGDRQQQPEPSSDRPYAAGARRARLVPGSEVPRSARLARARNVTVGEGSHGWVHGHVGGGLGDTELVSHAPPSGPLRSTDNGAPGTPRSRWNRCMSPTRIPESAPDRSR